MDLDALRADEPARPFSTSPTDNLAQTRRLARAEADATRAEANARAMEGQLAEAIARADGAEAKLEKALELLGERCERVEALERSLSAIS